MEEQLMDDLVITYAMSLKGMTLFDVMLIFHGARTFL